MEKKIVRLSDHKALEPEVLKLIELSFGYQPENSFKVDFYPLIKPENHQNCFVLLVDGKVTGHIGCLQKKITLKSKHLINMFGGIVLAKEYRGKGLFKEFFETVQKNFEQAALSFLWSDKLDLYARFNFFPCVDLYQYHQRESSDANHTLRTCLLKDLSEAERDELKQLYLRSDELRIDRSAQDWEDLKQITSAQLLLLEANSKIENYAFIHKGQDLPGVVHEYGYLNSEFLKILTQYGNVWTPQDFESPRQQLYGSVVKAHPNRAFRSFVKEHCDVEVKDFNGNDILLNLEGEEFDLDIKDFLPGVFGPGQFKEISAKSLFISGLDSI